MFILISDLHLEQRDSDSASFSIQPSRHDADIVLVVAGDAGTHHSAYEFLYRMTKQFKAVVFVLGNNEHQLKNIHRTASDLLGWMDSQKGGRPDNFFLLDRDTAIIDDTVFIGATLWTDLQKGQALGSVGAMVDYHRIYRDDKQNLLTPMDTWLRHQMDLEYIANSVKAHASFGKRIVVVTHHAPSMQSISPLYINSPENPCFASDLTELDWIDLVDDWCHGHVHHGLNYLLPNKKTRISCNPRGKVGPFKAENPEFNPRRRIV